MSEQTAHGDASSVDDEVHGLIGWFAKNHVAANLMMFAIILGGLAGVFFLKKETFPEFQSNMIQIQVPYLGAAPEEVEKAVILRIEEAIESIEGIHEISSTASEGMGSVRVELKEGVETADMTDELKLAIDGISTFPNETERPMISEFRFMNGVVNIQLAGDLDEATMKELADTIFGSPARRVVHGACPCRGSPRGEVHGVGGAQVREISVEISESALPPVTALTPPMW